MTVYSFYLFDRRGVCLCYREWSRAQSMHSQEDDQKTMFGMLFALRNFTAKLAPAPASPTDAAPRCFRTDVYALHYLETPTGLRFVLTTSSDTAQIDIVEKLREIYADIYVQYVVRNPLYIHGSPIISDVFTAKLDAYIQSLPCF